MGVHFGERIGEALAGKLSLLKPDIVVGAATLGIPVVIEVSRALGLDQYVNTSSPRSRRRFIWPTRSSRR
jgi:adenine phosphoribosyltransferase